MKTKTILTVCLITLATALNAQNFEWVKIIETANMNGSCIDANGNIYMTGVFNGTNDFDPGAGTYNLTSSGEDDIFVQKLDASGNFVWARCIGGSSDDYGYFIEVDAIGNVYVLGLFSGIVDFDPGIGITNLDSANDGSGFVQKLDSSGNFLWLEHLKLWDYPIITSVQMLQETSIWQVLFLERWILSLELVSPQLLQQVLQTALC